MTGTDFAVRNVQVGNYVGRFAPSPTGPLHFGSLLAAVASYLQAKVAGGQWLIRIEDLDTPRVVPGAADDILRTLAGFGFEWDGPVTYQSRRLALYDEAVAELRASGRVYECSCSRAQIAAQHAASELVDSDELRYAGTCRHRSLPHNGPTALRFVVSEGPTTFIDRIQGLQTQVVASTLGDFVIRRRDGLHAYHLAVVVDDHEQGVNEIVRGADLLGSTARQILLQQTLRYATPRYAHIPVALDRFGHKLSKSSQSLPIHVDAAARLLWSACQTLCQEPPAELQGASVGLLWEWAVKHWRPGPLTGHTQCSAPLSDLPH